jgi:hypothetical protein
LHGARVSPAARRREIAVALLHLSHEFRNVGRIVGEIAIHEKCIIETALRSPANAGSKGGAVTSILRVSYDYKVLLRGFKSGQDLFCSILAAVVYDNEIGSMGHL